MSLITRDFFLALKHLQAGVAVAIPTETVYGLAALVDNEKAIRQVFALKNRPLDHPLIVHVAPDADLSPYVEFIPDYAKILMKHFWPGPLTLVLKANTQNLNPIITAGQSTVAIRSPRHPLTEKLLAALTAPLVAPSANPFGKISPTTAEHVKHAFPNANITILDGGRCSVGIESTIIDATQDDSYQILRQGLITEEAISKIIPATYQFCENQIKVPGKLASHYQPNKSLYYFDDFEKLQNFCQKHKKVFVLADTLPVNGDETLFYALPASPEKLAFELYYQLRLADSSMAACIALVLPPETQPWIALRERILKAGMAGK